MAWTSGVDLEVARSALEESLAIFRELGDDNSAAVTLQYLGFEALWEGDATTAAAHFETALSTLRKRRNRWGLAHALTGLGQVRLFTGDLRSARLYLEEALQVMSVVDPMRALVVVIALARVAAAEGDPERGARLLGAVEALAGPGLRAMPPVFRMTHEQGLTEAHRGLAGPVFEAALAQGRSLALEQAIDQARG
jgi:ATP/maltotriose-dependent transcriptional regulator MalT